MFSILIFFVGFHNVLCHMPMEFRKYIESKLIMHKEDYPLFKQPLRNGLKNIFVKVPLRRKITTNTNTPPTITDKQVIVDKTIHYLISTNHPKYSDVSAFEEDFHNLLGMKGFKYIYKRGKLWRTWREVEDESLQKKILIYRGENNEDRTCAECHNRGYWALEVEPVQCPYEIFSMKNANNVCVTDVKHFAKGIQCTKYTRLKTLKNNCNNPIITKWRFTKTYDILERNLPESSVICQGREKCEVTTTYQFQPNQIIFRIVDEKNLIIYSRVMRKNEKNFACVDNCGYFDIDNMLVQNTPVTNSNKLNLVKYQPKAHHTVEQSTCSSPNEETTQKLQFIDEQPIINWKSHEFKFNNTINQREASAAKQASDPVTSDNKEIPIARFGHRVGINPDINNNFLNDITKVYCTTKLQCRNIIKDGDCYDDASGNTYYNDDEEKEINIDNY